MVLDPANFTFFGLDLQKAPAMLDNLESLPVHHLCDSVTDGCHAVAKVSSPSPDVYVFV
jgi:hypothetical protein